MMRATLYNSIIPWLHRKGSGKLVSDVFFVLGAGAVLLSTVMFYIASEKLRDRGDSEGYTKRAVYTVSAGGIFFILSYIFAFLS